MSRTTWTGVLKIQRPIVTTEETQLALIYNQARTINQQFPITSDLAEMFDEGEYKIFALAHPDEKGHLNIVSKAYEDDWDAEEFV